MPRTKFTEDSATAATFDDVRAVQGNYGTIHVNGRSDLNDGFGGAFVVDELDLSTPDDNLDVLVTKKGLRYKRRTIETSSGTVLVRGTNTPRPLSERWATEINLLDFMPLGTYAKLVNNTNENSLSSYLQTAINESLSLTGSDLGNTIVLPRGTILIPEMVTVPTTSTAYTEGVGCVIVGNGPKTIITQNLRGASDVVDYSDKSRVAEQHALAVFGSNTTIRDLTFAGCKGAIYYGQDPNSATGSEVSFCFMNNVDIKNCGTAVSKIVSVGPGQGTKYNVFNRVHVAQCQIAGYWDEIAAVIANNNRNTWSNSRVARCNMGLWVKNGGTNDFIAMHFEGVHSDVSATNYDLPAGTEDTASWAIVLDADASDNNFIGCYCESNDWDLWNNGAQNRFIGGYIRPDNCKFSVRPLQFTSHPSLLILDQYTGLNTGAARTDVLSGMAPGYWHEERAMIVGNAPFGVPSTGLAHQLMAVASASANAPLAAFRYGATAVSADVAGIKSRSTTASGHGALNANDIVARFLGKADDGVSNYVELANLAVVVQSAPSSTNAHSALRGRAIGSSSLTPIDVWQADATGVSMGGLPGAESFRAARVVSAVNRIQASGNTTGNSPYLLATGSDPNVSFPFVTTGSGSFLFRTDGVNGVDQFSIERVASADRRVRAYGGTSGSPAKLDTSAGDLQLAPASGIVQLGQMVATSTIKTGVFTVATLPAAATAGNGARAMVTDANSTTFMAAVVGGGANKVPVVCDGSQWSIG